MNQNNQQTSSRQQLFQLDLQTEPYLQEHRFQEMIILPGAVYFERMLALATELGIAKAIFTEIVFHQPLRLDEKGRQLTLVSSPLAAGGAAVQFCSGDGEPFMSGNILPARHPVTDTIDLKAMSAASQQQRAGQDFYQQLARHGNQYGAAFQLIQQIKIGSDTALATLRPPQNETAVLPLTLDACVQTLAATVDGVKRPFLWRSAEKMIVNNPIAQPAFAYAQRQQQDANGITGEVYLLDAAGAVLVALRGVRLEYAASSTAKPQTLAITATFTAEPIADSLNFWCQTAELPYEVAFAPYNQVFQQLLDPTSLLAQNKQGVNLLLIRPEDWYGHSPSLPLQVSLTEKERLLANHARYPLTEQTEIAHLAPYETDYLVQEIFHDNSYLKHGIALHDGDCVIDVGANIGMFTLFVQQHCPNATIYAFEPATAVFDILQTNATLYGTNVKAFNLGLSNEVGQAPFTFYKNSSVFSTVHADTTADAYAIKTIVQNTLKVQPNLPDAKQHHLADRFMADRLTAVTETVQLTTLSQIIREQQIEQIDLLKIDVERSEWDVLQGIEAEHWPRIKQIVIEVHDQQGDLIAAVMALLKDKGFTVVLDEEALLHGSGLYNVYARRPENAGNQPPASKHATSPEFQQIMAEFVQILQLSSERSQTPHLVCFCPPTPEIVASPAQAAVYQQMMQSLEAACDAITGVQVLKTAVLEQRYPVPNKYDQRTDKLGHIPYTPAYYAALGSSVARQLALRHRPPYKVIVLDCDQTLWQGVCGEDGANGVVLDAPRRTLQQFMVAQGEAGMLLCLCSKNSEADVLDVFQQRSEMPITLDHLAAWRINWQPKSENIRSLAQELQLGLDTFIFIDDNPLECAEVRAHCPEVLTLQLPQEAAQIPTFLDHVWAFDQLQKTAVDQQRATFYQQNSQRQQLEEESSGLADFLSRLQLEVHIAPLKVDQLARVSQLTYRTNQFNCTTIRRSETEIHSLVDTGEQTCLTVTVRDRFGAYGLVGVILFTETAVALQVDTFLLSCRALGRRVEHHMLAKLGQLAQERGLKEIIVPYIPTARNQPAHRFLASVADTSTPLEDGTVLYRVRSETAVQLLTQQPDDQLGLQRGEAGQTETAVVGNGRYAKSHLFNQIATELNGAQRVLAHMEQLTQRKPASQMERKAAPTNELEIMIARIWQNVLNVTQVGIHDDFFEMGGSSLKGVQLLALLERTLSQRDISLDISPVSLRKHPTIKQLADLIARQTNL